MLEELLFNAEQSPELNKILDTTELLFRKYGIRSVSMDDIAQSLGISKKTIYVHIENKDVLVDKVLKRHFTQEFNCVQQLMAQAQNALDELRLISLHVQQEMQNISHALMFDLQKYYAEAWQFVMKFQNEVIRHQIEANLERGIAQGLYRKDLNISLIGRIYSSTLPIFADNSFFEHHSRAQIHHQFIKYHILGIVSDEGRNLLKTYQMFEQ